MSLNCSGFREPGYCEMLLMPLKYRNVDVAEILHGFHHQSSIEEYRAAPGPAKRRPLISHEKKRFVKHPHKPMTPEQKIVKPQPKAVKHVKKPTPSIPTIQELALKMEADMPDDIEMQMTPSVEPTPDGYYELSPLVSHMLENELQRIMIKVWQELPDEPPSEAEKLVIEKFRNKAGDDFRNALGLNVTKRLLNIHNSLFVKLSFSRKANGSHLKALMTNFNCVAVKSVGGSDHLFAAQLRSIDEFDRICSAGVIQCGDATVNVTPSYKFLHCPSKVKTIYSDKDKDTTKEPEKENTVNEDEKKSTENNLNNKTEDILSKQENNDIPKVDTEVDQDKVENSKSVIKSGENISETKIIESEIKAKPVATSTTKPATINSEIKKVDSPVAKITQAKTNVATLPSKVAPTKANVSVKGPKAALAKQNVQIQTAKFTPAKLQSKVTAANATVQIQTPKTSPDKSNVQAKTPNATVQIQTPITTPDKPNMQAQTPKATSANSAIQTETSKSAPVKPNMQVETSKADPVKPNVQVQTAKATPVNTIVQVQTPSTKDVEEQVSKDQSVAEKKLPVPKVTPTKANLMTQAPKTTPAKPNVVPQAVKATSVKANVVSKAKVAPGVTAKVAAKPPSTRSRAKVLAQAPKTNPTFIKTTIQAKKAKEQKKIIFSKDKQTHTAVKIPSKKKVEQKVQCKTDKISNLMADDNAEFDDDDELDDEDILALMSQAIILDECSGSDEE